MISVVIVDDHQVVRTGLRHLLDDNPDITITAEYDDGSVFLSTYPQLKPFDVLLLDILMPRTGGLEVMKELGSCKTSPGVIFLTVHPEETYAIQAFQAGAKGYLNKDCSKETLIDAVHAVASGGMYFSSKTRKLMINGTGEKGQDMREIEKLSRQELKVFTYICRGLTVKEIAYSMSISQKTVSTYKSRLTEKLGAKNLTEVIKAGISWGIC